jgi:hypothetical protein
MGLLFDFDAQIIDVTSPQTSVIIQDLIDAIRTQEAHLAPGLGYPKIADATGKESLGGGILTGITVNLYPNWQIRFWAGSYQAEIKGGNIVGGLGGNPIAYTPGVQVKLVQSAASTIVNTGGSALTSEEHDRLMTGLDMTVPAAVWEEILSTHNTTGSAGKIVQVIKKKATLATIK